MAEDAPSLLIGHKAAIFLATGIRFVVVNSVDKKNFVRDSECRM